MKRTILITLVVLYTSGASAWGKNDKKDPTIKQVEASSTECALVANSDDSIVQYDWFAGTCPPDPQGKDYRWIPVVGTAPTYDAATQVLEGPTTTVEPTQVMREWTVRAKTAPEADAELQVQIDSLPWPVKDTLCDLYDRTSQLEGAGTKSEAQCNAYLKGFAAP